MSDDSLSVFSRRAAVGELTWELGFAGFALESGRGAFLRSLLPPFWSMVLNLRMLGLEEGMKDQ